MAANILSTTFDPALLAAVEDASLNASAPPQQRWLDGWLLRLSPGKARRARCVHALGPGRLSLPHRLQAAREVYAAAGLPLCFRLTPFSHPASLDEELGALGLPAVDPTLVMVSERLPSLPASPPNNVTWRPLRAQAFAKAVGALRGSAPEAIAAHAERLGQSPVPWQGAAWLAGDGQVLAAGQVASEGPLVGLYDVVTAPAARNQGLGTALCERLLSEASRGGARAGYLQVDGENHTAQRIYTRFGFQPAYGYHYRVESEAA